MGLPFNSHSEDFAECKQSLITCQSKLRKCETKLTACQLSKLKLTKLLQVANETIEQILFDGEEGHDEGSC